MPFLNTDLGALSGAKLAKAVEYNRRKAADIGWRPKAGNPYGTNDPGDERLALIIENAQAELRLTADGQLGPASKRAFVAEIAKGSALGTALAVFLDFGGGAAAPAGGAGVSDWARRSAEVNGRLAASLGWSVKAGNPLGISGPADVRLPGPVSDWQKLLGLPVDGQLGEGTMKGFIAAVKFNGDTGKAIDRVLRFPGGNVPPGPVPPPNPVPPPGPVPPPNPVPPPGPVPPPNPKPDPKPAPLPPIHFNFDPSPKPLPPAKEPEAEGGVPWGWIVAGLGLAGLGFAAYKKRKKKAGGKS